MAPGESFSEALQDIHIMKRIKVNLGKRSYAIAVGSGILKYLPVYLKSLNLPRELFVITNSRIKNQYGAQLKACLGKGGFSSKFYTTMDSEKAKSINNAVRTIEFLADYAKQKKIALVAFGGGVIGDLSSFIASIYKRGVPLVQIPTTLLAQIDSSIGGKTAIDLKMAKNLVGTFYQPRLVFCELDLLMTLDKKQLRAGLSEAVKYALIQDGKLFRFLEEEYQSIFSKDTQALERLVFECARIKARVVELDEKEEKGLRTILNFGHTIGHAVEAAGDYDKYSHGEAVSLGMLASLRISQNMGMLDSMVYRRIANLIAHVGGPQEIEGLKERDVLTAYKLDKKFIGRTNRFVLLKGIGKPVVCKNIPENIIYKAVRELFVS